MINKKIVDFEEDFNHIIKDKNLNNKEFKIFSDSFVNIINQKISKLRKFKSYKAILNNSFRIIQKLKVNIDSNKYEELYLMIMTLDKDYTINAETILKNINALKPNNLYEEYFLKHSTNIVNNFVKLEKIKEDVYDLDISNKLNEFNQKYIAYVNKTFSQATISIFIIFSLLVILIGFYIFHEYKIFISNRDLNRFRKTVENSDNIVLITDKNKNIKYVNDAFTKTTGYKLEEIIGRKPNMLKSGLHSKEFYDNLNETIYSGEKWSGDFINVDKFGELSYEKASITPVLDENNEISEFIAIKLDITKETLIAKQLRKNEIILAEKTKISSMINMIENIAHQWRQPLSIISTGATGMLLQKQIGQLSDEQFEFTCNLINKNTQYLSKTINDFNNYIKGDDNSIKFNLKATIEEFLKLIEPSSNMDNIKIISNVEEISIVNYPNQLIQCLMNFYNNSIDAFKKHEIKEKLIFIECKKREKEVAITFKDNAQGIDEELLSKLFEPYFTSKHRSQGKGLGLHIIYNLVTSSMKGSISVENVNFNYNDNSYSGLEFTILLPFGN